MPRGNREPEYRRRIREKAEKYQYSAQAKERESTEKRNSDKIGSAIKRIEQELRRTNDEHTPQKNRDRCWERFGFLGLWFAGVVGVVAILVGTYDAQKQRVVMSDQLTEMATQRLFTIAQTRANLRRESPSIIPIDYFGTSPEAGDKLVGWKVIPIWKNVGSTDAQNFRGWSEIKAFDVRPKHTVGIRDCPTQPIDTLPQGEITIAPGDIAVQPYRIFYKDDVKKGMKYILMWGHIDYLDIFPHTPPHNHDWCMVVIPDDIDHSKFSFDILRDRGD